MELILDGEIYTEGINEDNIATKIQECVDQVNLEGKLIKQVFLNGEKTPEILQQPEVIYEKAGEEGIKKVELVSVTQGELVDETLETLTGYLTNLDEYIHKLANSIKNGDIPDKESILQLTDSLEWVFQAANGLVITLQDSEIKEKVDELQDTFSDILNSLKKEDYPTFGKIIENELSSKLEEIRIHFSKKLEKRRGSEN